MCGICGIVDYRSGFITENKIRSMSDKMAHRGPDDAGIYLKMDSIPQVALGHRRLSIIDLSERGHQPMSNEDGKIWVVFNGEIYNYRELKTGLEDLGHKFRSDTDTETVIHLYEEYGEDCVKHMRGMFAFAIWDSKNNMLLLARDRIGKKPLLYYNKGGKFCFASEFLSLLESGLIKKDINHEAIHYYLTFGYIPAPLTIYKDVFKLPPAHMLIAKNDKVVIKQYWSLDYSKKIAVSEEDAAAEVLRLLKEAVGIRLYSDVPLGAFLSGGIDSSTIVALMSEISGTKIKTFSIGFEEEDYTELKYAKRIADKFNTEHHEFIVKPRALDILPLLVERYGEPYADSSSIPTYYVCNETKKHVTVALNGDGGDELFAGYDRYQAMLASEIYKGVPLPIKSIVRNFVEILPDSVNSKNRIRRLKRFFDGAELPIAERYLRWVGISSDDFRAKLYSEDLKKELYGKDPVVWLKPYLSNSKTPDFLDKLLMADMHTYLPGDLLVKVDIASMANSLEARSPFLDHKLIEFVTSLPSQYKMKHLVKKYILKKAIRNIVPHENIYRKKMGFGLPVGQWFRNDLRDFLKNTLLSATALKRGYFKAGSVEKIVNEHLSKRGDFSFQLWALLMLELWHRRFID